MVDTTDPRYWSHKITDEGITASFLRPTGGKKSGILERGFWPGDRPAFGPHGSKPGLLFRLRHLFDGTNSGSNFGDYTFGGLLKPWTWFQGSKPPLLKNIDLRTRRGGPSTVPEASQGKNIWALYNFAQKKQHFGNIGDSPTWFQRPGFIDRGADYERPGFIQS